MGLPALKDDYLFIAPLIERHIKDKVGDVPVAVCETADQVLSADQRTTVVMVMFAGDAFGDDAGAGKSQQLRQRWLVIVGIKNASGKADARQVKAGPLMSKLHAAMVGWSPAGAVKPFKRVTANMRPQISNTKALYPMGFEIELAL